VELYLKRCSEQEEEVVDEVLTSSLLEKELVLDLDD